MDLFNILLAKTLAGGGGGGGGSSYTLLHEQDVTVSTTSTSATAVAQIQLPADEVLRTDKIIYVRIRDKAGKRNGYFFGTDNYFIRASGASSTYFYTCYRYSDDVFNLSRAVDPGSSGSGIYLREIKNSGIVRIDVKYNSSFSRTIDGTYHIEIYTLDWPGNVSPFA